MKKDNIWILIIVAIFILYNSQINGVNSKLNDMEYKLQDAQNQIDELNNIIYEQKERSKVVNSVDFKIIDTTKDFISNMKVKIDLNKLDNNSTPVFMYKENSKDTWTECQLESVSRLSYTTTIELNQNKNYKYKIVTTGDVNESTEVEVIDPVSYSPNLTNWGAEGSSNGELSIYVSNPYGQTPYNNREEFKLKDVYVEVVSNNETKRYDLEKQKNDEYRLDFKTKDKKEKYKVYLVAEFKNGLIKKEYLDM